MSSEPLSARGEEDGLLSSRDGQRSVVDESATPSKSTSCARICVAVIWVPVALWLLVFWAIFFFCLAHFQCNALQSPGNPLYWPWFTAVSTLESFYIGTGFAMMLRQGSFGDNFCAAGQVWLSSYADVSSAILAPQERKNYLGEHRLIDSHTPEVGGRNVFLLSLGDDGLPLGEPGMHAGVRKAFIDTLLPMGSEQQARMKDDVAEELWDKLVQDYVASDLGKDAFAFFENAEKGLQPFVRLYLHYVMFGIHPGDAASHDILVAFLGGSPPVLYYFWPIGYAYQLFTGTQSLIAQVIDVYMNSPAFANFTEGKKEYANVTKSELAAAASSIMRIAGIQGTQALVHVITGFFGNPGWPNEDPSFDKMAVWDSLDLNDTYSLESYIYESARLNTPVTCTHHVATEDFTADIAGTRYSFPQGTVLDLPIALADVDPKHWGPNAHNFNMSREGLQEDILIFNSKGDQSGGRICPGKSLVMHVGVEVLKRLGQARRAHA